jgi:hypothetical protein
MNQKIKKSAIALFLMGTDPRPSENGPFIVARGP